MRRTAGSRSRRRGRLGSWLLYAAVTLGLLAAAFWFGREVGLSEQAARLRALEEQLAGMEEAGSRANVALAQAQQQLVEAQAQAGTELAALTARLPEGELGGIVDLLRTRIASGVPAERLRFLVEQAGPERRCKPGVEKRRFAPRLPTEVSPLQTVSFLDNRITVSATGVPARDKDGVAQPWFDPSQPVDIRLLRIGGGIELVKGVLPSGHSVVADGREYRLNFAQADKRGLVEVSLQDCAYP